MTIEYTCSVLNRDSDITYSASEKDLESARKRVDYYRQLVRDNGEEDIMSYIEITKDKLDDDDEIISSQVIETHHI